MDAEARKKVRELERKALAQNRKYSQVIEENVRLTKKVYEMQSCIDEQADRLAEYSETELVRENKRLTKALKKIADGRGKYAKIAEEAISK